MAAFQQQLQKNTFFIERLLLNNSREKTVSNIFLPGIPVCFFTGVFLSTADPETTSRWKWFFNKVGGL